MCYVQEIRGENADWPARAESDVIDQLLGEVSTTYTHTDRLGGTSLIRAGGGGRCRKLSYERRN